MAGPGRCLPPVPVTGRHYVDMTVQDQRSSTTWSQRPRHQPRLLSVRLHPGEARVHLQPSEVRLECVDLEARIGQRLSHPLLHRRLISGHRRNPDELLGEAHACLRVETFECLGLRPDQVLTVPIRIRSRPSIWPSNQAANCSCEGCFSLTSSSISSWMWVRSFKNSLSSNAPPPRLA